MFPASMADLPSEGDVTRLVRALKDESGEDRPDALLSEIVETLRQIAHRQLAHERADHTLDTVGLVNEAYLKMSREDATWENRSHFYGSAARAMRQVLVSYARSRNAQKRGGGVEDVSLDNVLPFLDGTRSDALLELDEALSQLEAARPRLARVVECRYFIGLTVPETASALDISPATVVRDWRMARAWLRREMANEQDQDG